jgi:carbonic anhydrase
MMATAEVVLGSLKVAVACMEARIVAVARCNHDNCGGRDLARAMAREQLTDAAPTLPGIRRKKKCFPGQFLLSAGTA